MGHLSNMRARGYGPRPRSNGSKTGPLKKIVGHVKVGYATMEALECGHFQMPKQDLMGETNAVRRRCTKCKSGSPVIFTGEPPTHMTSEEYHKKCLSPKPSQEKTT
jgi:hypothetical protein